MVCQTHVFHLLGANHYRLDEADGIYGQNGCHEMTKYGQIFLVLEPTFSCG